MFQKKKEMNRKKNLKKITKTLLTFRVLPDRHQVHVVVSRLVPGDTEARPDVGVQLELLPQRQVERPMPFPDRRRHGPLESDAVLEHAVEVLARHHRVGPRVDCLADVLLVPGDGDARGLEDGADGVGDLRADAYFFGFEGGEKKKERG